MRKALDVLGYVFVAGLFALALTAAARGEEAPSQFIWQAKDGTYTNLPLTHGDVKQVELTRDRLTPVKRTARPHDWAAAAPQARSGAGGGDDFCREVYLFSPARGGGVTVCGGERATVREQRVRRKGSLTTSTDTVITVDGAEVMRIQGRQWNTDPSETVR